MVKKIKAYELLTARKQTITDADDRAMAEFRGFYHVAEVHVERAETPSAIDVMLEIIENVENSLRQRKKMLTLP